MTTHNGDPFTAYLAAELMRYFERGQRETPEFSDWTTERPEAARDVADAMWHMAEAAQKQCLGGAVGRMVTDLAGRVAGRLEGHAEATGTDPNVMRTLRRAAGEAVVLEDIQRPGTLRRMARELYFDQTLFSDRLGQEWGWTNVNGLPDRNLPLDTMMLEGLFRDDAGIFYILASAMSDSTAIYATIHEEAEA